ncbi:MAG: hypothetical protein AAFV95_02865 [Bacteroidota bacterium]
MKPKPRRQLAHELGISYPTFWRLLKKKNIFLPKGLLSPESQEKIVNCYFELANDPKEKDQ